jgi:hypothetical protein
VTKAATKPDEGRRLLEFFGNSTTGCFVEVGTGNPAQGSITIPLEDAGWNGVMSSRARMSRRFW